MIGIRSFIHVFVLYILLGGVLLFSEVEEFSVEPVNQQLGLSNSTVFCIFQDQAGFLWFGTDNGLNKYDGYSIKTYRHYPGDPTSVSNNSIRTIVEDAEGVLWIGTFGGGLDKFDPGRERFTHFVNDPENSNSPGNDFILSLHYNRNLEGEEILWIGTFKGLDKFEIKKGKFSHFSFMGDDSTGLEFLKIRTIYEDEDGKLWLGSLGGGLLRFNPFSGDYIRFLYNPDNRNTLSHNMVLTVRGDLSGKLWIGTAGGGLNRYSPQTGKFICYKTDSSNPVNLCNDDVRILFPDSSGLVWIGTANGLDCFDIKKGEFFCLPVKSTSFSDLNCTGITSIYEDPGGLIWIGTLYRGIYKIDRQKKKFRHYYNNLDDSASLGNNMVETLFEDKSGILWVGTNGGLDKWDRKTGLFSHYRVNHQKSDSLSDNCVWSIYEDRSSRLWIGTLDGLNRLERNTGRFYHYKPISGDPHSLSNNKILTITEDDLGNLWIGTYNGLNRLEPGKVTFNRYLYNPTQVGSISNNLILSILVDRQQVVWVGTINGLNRYNRKTDFFNTYVSNGENPNSISNNRINCIYEDKQGFLWLGTYGGLNKFDRVTNRFSHYTIKDGLASDVILGILEDAQGRLWLGTSNGLTVFSPPSGRIKNYDSNDGLQSNEFRKACWKSNRGEMFFGGVNGFNSFFPEDIVDNLYPPKVVITGFKIFNEPVRVGKKIDGLLILKNSISDSRDLILSYKHSALTFEFVALHYAAPESNHYKFKMEGIDSDWVDAGKRREAFYPYIKPGKYVFKVKASNNDDLWSEGKPLCIYIPPPFWKRWWFLMIMGGVLLLMVYGGYYYRTKWLREKLVEQERVQKLLELSRDEMKKSKDIVEFRGAENAKLIAAISSIFIKVEANGNISQWNNSAEKFFRLPSVTVLNKSFVEVLKGYISGEHLESIMDMGLNRDEASHNIEIQVDFEDDSDTKQFLATINPIIDKHGKKFGFLLLGENITQQKKEQMRMLLSQKLEALGQISAGIAHEIRSPLQYVGNNVQFLLEAFSALIEACEEIKNFGFKIVKGEAINIDKLNIYLTENEFEFYLKEIPSSLDHIINGVTRISNIVHSMSKLSYIGNELNEKADLNDILDTTLVVAHNRIKNVADLERNFAENLPPIYCAIGELSQVFLNLLINAADAIAETGKRGLIKITTQQKENELIVEISDNGVGIADAIKNKIFATFFTTKRIGHGTGQGLPFSHSIVVERHKGKLYHKSEVNKGTTFFVHLPIQSESINPEN